MIEFGVGFIVGFWGSKLLNHIFDRIADRRIVPSRVSHIRNDSKYVTNIKHDFDSIEVHPAPGQIWRLDSCLDDDVNYNVDVHIECVEAGIVTYSFMNREKTHTTTLLRARKPVKQFMKIYKYMNCWKKLGSK